MANPEQLKRLKQGVEDWNAWRGENDDEPDLSGADLTGAALSRSVSAPYVLIFSNAACITECACCARDVHRPLLLPRVGSLARARLFFRERLQPLDAWFQGALLV
jgi:hypothetical protein